MDKEERGWHIDDNGMRLLGYTKGGHTYLCILL